MAALQRPKRFGIVFFTFILLFSGFASLSQPAVAGTTEIDYCDYGNVTSGSVAQWLNSAPEGANTDCIDIWIESQGCGYLDIRIIDRVLNLTPTNRLFWTEGAADVFGSRQSTFPITFPEDYNGGSVQVTVVLSAPEKDFVDYAGTDALTYWSGNQVDQTFTIQTDCVQTQVEWCSPGFWKNHTGAWTVSLDTSYEAATGTNLVDKKGNDVPDASLFEVISQPQVYGGWQTELAASYLSGQAGLSGEVPDGSLPVVCPL